MSLLDIPNVEEFVLPIDNRPKFIKAGRPAFGVPSKLVNRKDEMGIGLSFICDRRLFGYCYQILQPDFFEQMGLYDGVFIAPFVLSNKVLKGMQFPGDIDLLVIPYQGNNLILTRSIAMELKIVRATFAKQGKSPSEYGFSQATALLSHGFPYVAVCHLVISDISPPKAWRSVLITKVLDDFGHASTPQEFYSDMMPGDLLERSFGRLIANCPNKLLGLFTAYPSEDQLWFPHGRPALRNGQLKPNTLYSIYEFFCLNYKSFLDTPRHPLFYGPVNLTNTSASIYHGANKKAAWAAFLLMSITTSVTNAFYVNAQSLGFVQLLQPIQPGL